MVQVILKAFDIIELVAQRNGQAVSLTEISEELDINQATAANIINTIVSRGYMEHIGKKKGYRLGPAAFRLTNEIPYEKDLVNVARQVMEELTTNVNESCILGVLRNHKRYILHVVNAAQDIQVQLRSERNTYDTATGRLLLAYLSDKELERYIQHNGLPDAETWAEAQTMDDLMSELGHIKNAGIVHTYKQNRHIKGFAVPIFINEQVVASLSVFLPEYRCTAARQQEIIERLKASADVIGQKLSV